MNKPSENTYNPNILKDAVRAAKSDFGASGYGTAFMPRERIQLEVIAREFREAGLVIGLDFGQGMNAATASFSLRSSDDQLLAEVKLQEYWRSCSAAPDHRLYGFEVVSGLADDYHRIAHIEARPDRVIQPRLYEAIRDSLGYAAKAHGLYSTVRTVQFGKRNGPNGS